MSTEASGSWLQRAGATAWRLLGIGLAVVAAWWLAQHLMPLVVPLVVSLLLAALLMPVADALHRRGVPRAAAALGAMVVLIGVVALAILLIVPAFVDRASALGSNLRQGLEQVV